MFMKKKVRDEADKNALITEEENIDENIKIIETGVCLRKGRTKLPANLFLDDTGSWSQIGQWGYFKIINFQANNNEKANANIIIPMSIGEEPQILIDNVEILLTPREIEQIKAFVRNNKDLLLRLDALEIDIFDFVEGMKINK